MTRPLFLSHFTPSLMKPEDLEAIFVQREGLAKRLVGLVEESALTPTRHQSLLVGPRGMGKTHLVALVYHRLKAKKRLKNKLRIAWLREEEWGIGSFVDLLVRILRALDSEYPEASLRERMETLFREPATAERHAISLVSELLGGRTLLVIAENLDDVFQGLGDEGQKRLRSWLQESACCSILATSQSLFNGVSLHKSPFYGFFDIQHLQEFGLEEATELLAKIAERTDDKGLAEMIRSPLGRARIRAVRHLAGGNPRVYVIFSQFLTRESLDSLVEPFMRMLDELTPYYQARMQWLSGQQRKIVAYLIEKRSTAQVKEIAEKCFLSPQAASAQLKDLRDKGYVVSHEVGRDAYYELKEPLMRMCVEVKKNRGGEPLAFFVEFLRLWYSKEELMRLLGSVPPGNRVDIEFLQVAIERAHTLDSDPRIGECEKELLRYLCDGPIGRAESTAEELVAIRGSGDDWAYLVFSRLLRTMDLKDPLGNFVHDIQNGTILLLMLLEAMIAAGYTTLTQSLLKLASGCAANGRTKELTIVMIARGAHNLSPSISLEQMQLFADRWRTIMAEVVTDGGIGHILDTAVRYKATGDERVFLDLPAEERELLEMMLPRNRG